VNTLGGNTQREKEEQHLFWEVEKKSRDEPNTVQVGN